MLRFFERILRCFNPVSIRSRVLSKNNKITRCYYCKVSIPYQSGLVFSVKIVSLKELFSDGFNPVSIRSRVLSNKGKPDLDTLAMFQSRINPVSCSQPSRCTPSSKTSLRFNPVSIRSRVLSETKSSFYGSILGVSIPYQSGLVFSVLILIFLFS